MSDIARGRVAATLCVVVLLAFVALGFCQSVELWHNNPLGSDHFIYSAAVEKAWAGQDPYLPRSIGWGYVYPPPSLLLLKAVELISPPKLGAAYTFMGLSVVAALVGVMLLAGRFTWWRLFVALLLFGSAGMIETIYVGQVNAIVLLFIALFFWAWRRGSPLLACVALGAAIAVKVTPAVLAVFFLARGKLKWLLALGACVAGLLLAAELLVPAPHLTSSFLASFRWAAQQPVYSDWNYSLSSSVSLAVQRLTGYTLDWSVLQWLKLLVLAALLATSGLTYLRLGQSAAATRSLFVTCNVCMVVAPNIVWLHHAALLIPALWILLVESDDRTVVASSMAALICIQCARCAKAHWRIPQIVPLDLAQILLLAACVVSTALLYRSGHRRLASGEEDVAARYETGAQAVRRNAG